MEIPSLERPLVPPESLEGAQKRIAIRHLEQLSHA